MSTGTVCVTGATGFIAAHIIRELLEGGYTVHGTVRALAKKEKYQFLADLATKVGASDRLKFFEADLLADDSFDEAVAGCDYVLHTASPFLVSKITDAQAQLVDPALKGTENVLASVAKAPTVKRVVVTSSIVSVKNRADEHGPNYTFSHKDWNEGATLKSDPYPLSKVLAEKRAWEIAKEHSSQYSLVTINPGLVVGPSLNTHANFSSAEVVTKFLNGELAKGAPELYMCMVDVRDVAVAHVAAMSKPEAEGRYLLGPEVMPFLGAADAIRTKFPQYPLPTKHLPKFLLYLVGPIMIGWSWSYIRHNIGIPFSVDRTKTETELGFTFRPVTTALCDMVQKLIDDGLVPKLESKK